MIDNKDFKEGFSLAEAMVMLTIVAILMAVSVPLIAKKSQMDTQTLWGHSNFTDAGTNFSGTSGGFGAHSRVGIGIKKALAKMHIQDSSANASPGGGNPLATVFQVNGNDPNKAFKVFADGSTNVRACVPDFGNAANSAIAATVPVAADGYLVANHCITVDVNTFCPSIYTHAITLNGTPPTSVSIENRFTGSVIVPVKESDTYSEANLPLEGNVTLSDINGAAVSPSVTFIHCAK